MLALLVLQPAVPVIGRSAQRIPSPIRLQAQAQLPRAVETAAPQRFQASYAPLDAWAQLEQQGDLHQQEPLQAPQALQVPQLLPPQLQSYPQQQFQQQGFLAQQDQQQLVQDHHVQEQVPAGPALSGASSSRGLQARSLFGATQQFDEGREQKRFRAADQDQSQAVLNVMPPALPPVLPPLAPKTKPSDDPRFAALGRNASPPRASRFSRPKDPARPWGSATAAASAPIVKQGPSPPPADGLYYKLRMEIPVEVDTDKSTPANTVFKNKVYNYGTAQQREADWTVHGLWPEWTSDPTKVSDKMGARPLRPWVQGVGAQVARQHESTLNKIMPSNAVMDPTNTLSAQRKEEKNQDHWGHQWEAHGQHAMEELLKGTRTAGAQPELLYFKAIEDVHKRFAKSFTERMDYNNLQPQGHGRANLEIYVARNREKGGWYEVDPSLPLASS